MRIKLLLLYLLPLFTACNYQEQKMDELSIITDYIDFYSLSSVPDSFFLSKNGTTYILLKNMTDQCLFSRIDRIKFANEKIYIVDTRMPSLVVYNKNGDPITKIGTQGQGPKEYLGITDFDIDHSGNVYVLDGISNKILHYNNKYECVNEHRLSYSADIITVLKNDSLLIGLSSWNEGEGKGYKIALTDKTGKISKTYLKYDEYTDPAYWISNYQFAKNDAQISYNQTIDNNIYLFSEEGYLQKRFYMDFGKENVPKKEKVNIESILSNYDSYCLIRKILAVTDRYIIGFIWQHRQTKMFIIDYIQKKCFLSQTIPDMDRRVGCGYSDTKLISYIDSESNALPDSVNSFVKDEGIALKIQLLDNYNEDYKP